MANSPLWMHKVLKDYHHKEKKILDLSDSLYIINGGGGWDGTKGVIKLGHYVNKSDFVEHLSQIVFRFSDEKENEANKPKQKEKNEL